MSDKQGDIHEQVDAILAALGRPRNTAVWQRSGAQVVAELQALLDDPKVQSAVTGCYLLAVADDSHFEAAFDTLLALTWDRAPTAGHCLGTTGWELWWGGRVMTEARLHIGDAAGAERLLTEMADRVAFAHFAGNPATLNRDGTSKNQPGMSRRDHLEMADFEASQRPAIKHGPKGPHTKKREAGPSAKQCFQVYDLHTKEALDWPDIYLRMHPGASVSPADAYGWCKPRYDKALRLIGESPEETPDPN